MRIYPRPTAPRRAWSTVSYEQKPLLAPTLALFLVLKAQARVKLDEEPNLFFGRDFLGWKCSASNQYLGISNGGTGRDGGTNNFQTLHSHQCLLLAARCLQACPIFPFPLFKRKNRSKQKKEIKQDRVRKLFTRKKERQYINDDDKDNI